jgi:hypothetical protein
MLLPTVLFFGMMCNIAFSFAKLPTIFWLAALAIGLFTSLIPFFFLREIRFPDEMVVRRYFLPDRFFSYKELEQINPDSIQVGGQRIRMGEITNLDELKDMSQRWIAAKTLKDHQRNAPKKESLYFQRGYGSYASFWGLMFGIIIMLMDLPWFRFDPRWALGGAFLIVYLVYIYVVPKYL